MRGWFFLHCTRLEFCYHQHTLSKQIVTKLRCSKKQFSVIGAGVKFHLFYDYDWQDFLADGQYVITSDSPLDKFHPSSYFPLTCSQAGQGLGLVLTRLAVS